MNAFDKDGHAINIAYSAPGAPLSLVYTVDGTAIGFFRDTAVLSALTSINFSGNKQGACTDGEYIYQFCISPFAGIKYKILDGTYTTVSLGSTIPYNHANDMAYNPNNQHLYVAAMSPDGAVMELDTNFNYITTHYLADADGVTYSVWGLCFDRETNRFYSDHNDGDGGLEMLIYDEQFNVMGKISLGNKPTATAQGCETDGDFIYHVLYNPNTIHVSAMDGTFIKSIVNPMSGEPETLMFDWDGHYYMNKNSSTDVFYSLVLRT